MYLVEVEFVDQPGSKLRPVVIVSQDRAIDLDVVVSPVTSMSPRSEFDVVIECWREAGLAKPSVARTTKTVPVMQTRLRKKLGELERTDLERVLDKCRSIFELNSGQSQENES